MSLFLPYFYCTQVLINEIPVLQKGLFFISVLSTEIALTRKITVENK